jgi:hypothetical protein
MVARRRAGAVHVLDRVLQIGIRSGGFGLRHLAVAAAVAPATAASAATAAAPAVVLVAVLAVAGLHRLVRFVLLRRTGVVILVRDGVFGHRFMRELGRRFALLAFGRLALLAIASAAAYGKSSCV